MQRLSVINGLRGYAILGVIYFHLIGTFFQNPRDVEIVAGGFSHFPLTFLSNGWLGVNLFFILSGFVLYLPYVKNERDFNKEGSIKKFYLHRGERLLPLYYITLIISIIFIIKESNIYVFDFWKRMFLMFTCTFNFSKETFIPSYNYVLWSLGIEILFSALFPLIILAVKRFGLRGVFFAVFYLSILSRIYAYMRPDLDVAPHLNMVKDSIAGRLDDFITGMLLCHLYFTGYKERLFKTNYFAWLVVSILIILIGCYFSDYIVTGKLARTFEPFINTIFQLGFGLLVLTVLHMPLNGLRMLFSNKPLQLCGMMCYSLYLWHGNIRWFFIADYTPLRIVMYCVFLFSLSWLTYRYIEFGKKDLGQVLPA